MVRSPLWLEAEAEGGAAGPPVVAPATASPGTRVGAVAIPIGRAPGVVQIGIDAARESRMIPIAAPLEDVAVHVVDAPRIGRIAADPRWTDQRRPLIRRTVVW